MTEEILDCGEGFWSIRGSFRIGGIVNIGTQCGLIRRSDGSFVFLDSYTLPESTLAQVNRASGRFAALVARIGQAAKIGKLGTGRASDLGGGPYSALAKGFLGLPRKGEQSGLPVAFY